MARQPTEIEALRRHLTYRWISWGIVPLLVCALVVGVLALWGVDGPVEGKQQTRLAFEIVLGVSAAVFLAGFYIDGHWTGSQRLARRIFREAGGDDDRNPASWAQSTAHRTALQEQADIALNSIRASADAITLMGSAIGLVAIVTVIMGLPSVHALQILVLGLAYQFFVFSRHHYYIRIAEAALDGQLLPSNKDEDDGDKSRRASSAGR